MLLKETTLKELFDQKGDTQIRVKIINREKQRNMQSKYILLNHRKKGRRAQDKVIQAQYFLDLTLFLLHSFFSLDERVRLYHVHNEEYILFFQKKKTKKTMPNSINKY